MRDRIARAMYESHRFPDEYDFEWDELGNDAHDIWRGMADKFIDDLGLVEETELRGYNFNDDGFQSWSRYVTGWSAG